MRHRLHHHLLDGGRDELMLELELEMEGGKAADVERWRQGLLNATHSTSMFGDDDFDDFEDEDKGEEDEGGDEGGEGGVDGEGGDDGDGEGEGGDANKGGGEKEDDGEGGGEAREALSDEVVALRRQLDEQGAAAAAVLQVMGVMTVSGASLAARVRLFTRDCLVIRVPGTQHVFTRDCLVIRVPGTQHVFARLNKPQPR